MFSFELISDKSDYLEELSNFLESHPNSNIFQSNALQKAYSYAKNHIPFSYILTNNELIVGCINGVILQNHLWPLRLFTTRAIIIGGPLTLRNDIDFLDKLLENFTDKGKKNTIYTQFRNLRELSESEISIFKKHGYDYHEHLNIIHDLTIPVEIQWRKIHKGRRKNIRRAEKYGIVFREIISMSEFEESLCLIKETYRRLKLPFPTKSLFHEMKIKFLDQGILKVFVASLENKIIATRMVLCYNELIYDWYAGASKDHLHLYPNDFLPWKIIEWGAQNGYKAFDFGGAGKPNVHYGVREHKVKFGGDLVEFGRLERIHYPLLMKLGRIGLMLKKKMQ